MSKTCGLAFHRGTDPLSTCPSCVSFIQRRKGEYYSADEARRRFYNDDFLRLFLEGIKKLNYPSANYYSGSP